MIILRRMLVFGMYAGTEQERLKSGDIHDVFVGSIFCLLRKMALLYDESNGKICRKDALRINETESSKIQTRPDVAANNGGLHFSPHRQRGEPSGQWILQPGRGCRL